MVTVGGRGGRPLAAAVKAALALVLLDRGTAWIRRIALGACPAGSRPRESSCPPGPSLVSSALLACRSEGCLLGGSDMFMERGGGGGRRGAILRGEGVSLYFKSLEGGEAELGLVVALVSQKRAVI